MTRSLTCELPCTKIEIRIFRELLKVWVEAEETRHLNHKHKVEVGRCGGRSVIPLKTILYEIIKKIVCLLCPCRIAKEFCKKERDREFYGIKRYSGIRLHDMSLLYNREIICRTAFVIHIENIKNLENLTLDLALACLRHSPHDTKSADLSGQQVNNETLIAIFHCSKHYTTGFLLHNRHKSTKIQ